MWITVPNEVVTEVRLVWKPTCDCCGEDEATTEPGGLTEGGPPMCPECGDDYEYVRTEVKLTPK